MDCTTEPRRLIRETLLWTIALIGVEIYLLCVNMVRQCTKKDIAEMMRLAMVADGDALKSLFSYWSRAHSKKHCLADLASRERNVIAKSVLVIRSLLKCAVSGVWQREHNNSRIHLLDG